MIIQELKEINGKIFTYTYSDQNLKIYQQETGIVYDTAYDGVPCAYSYIETDYHLDEEIPESGPFKITEEGIVKE